MTPAYPSAFCWGFGVRDGGEVSHQAPGAQAGEHASTAESQPEEYGSRAWYLDFSPVLSPSHPRANTRTLFCPLPISSFCPILAAPLALVPADGGHGAVSRTPPVGSHSTPLTRGGPPRNHQPSLPDSSCLPTLSSSPVSPGLLKWSRGNGRTKDPNAQVTFKGQLCSLQESSVL